MQRLCQDLVVVRFGGAPEANPRGAPPESD